MSSPRIKVCGITRKGDGQLALSLGASYLGFILYDKSPRGIDLDAYRELDASLTDSFRVAVDVKPSLEKVRELDQAGADFFQIHFSDINDRAYLSGLSQLVGTDRLWLAPKLPPGDMFPESLFEYTNTILIDTYQKDAYGGTGKTGDWVGFNRLKTDYPEKNWVLAGGLSPDNIQAAISQADPEILDVNSGVESSPGIKSPEKLRALFSKLST